MLKKITSLFIIALPAIVYAQVPAKGPLDKQRFTAEILEEGKKKPLDPDDLNFTAGKFKSVIFGDWGFTKAGKYEISSIDSSSQQNLKIYNWHAKLVNDLADTLNWVGVIKGDDIEGSIALINKKGTTKRTYTFTGKMKKKPGQK